MVGGPSIDRDGLAEGSAAWARDSHEGKDREKDESCQVLYNTKLERVTFLFFRQSSHPLLTNSRRGGTGLPLPCPQGQ